MSYLFKYSSRGKLQHDMELRMSIKSDVCISRIYRLLDTLVKMRLV